MNKSVKDKLQINATLPKGTKKRYKKPKDLKKELVEEQKVYPQPKPEPIEVEEAQHVIFQPNKGPQTEFLSSNEREVLYGGSAGGGKSYAMLADPVRYFCNS